MSFFPHLDQLWALLRVLLLVQEAKCAWDSGPLERWRERGADVLLGTGLQAIDRMLKADGLAGTPVAPVCGLAPGCPAATDWTALIMLMWKQAICQCIPRAIARDYVDDLVAHVVGEPAECVVAVWRMEVITRQFAAALEHRQVRPVCVVGDGAPGRGRAARLSGGVFLPRSRGGPASRANTPRW